MRWKYTDHVIYHFSEKRYTENGTLVMSPFSRCPFSVINDSFMAIPASDSFLPRRIIFYHFFPKQKKKTFCGENNKAQGANQAIKARRNLLKNVHAPPSKSGKSFLTNVSCIFSCLWMFSHRVNVCLFVSHTLETSLFLNEFRIGNSCETNALICPSAKRN